MTRVVFSLSSSSSRLKVNFILEPNSRKSLHFFSPQKLRAAAAAAVAAGRIRALPDTITSTRDEREKKKSWLKLVLSLLSWRRRRRRRQLLRVLITTWQPEGRLKGATVKLVSFFFSFNFFFSYFIPKWTRRDTCICTQKRETELKRCHPVIKGKLVEQKWPENKNNTERTDTIWRS